MCKSLLVVQVLKDIGYITSEDTRNGWVEFRLYSSHLFQINGSPAYDQLTMSFANHVQVFSVESNWEKCAKPTEQKKLKMHHYTQLLTSVRSLVEKTPKTLEFTCSNNGIFRTNPVLWPSGRFDTLVNFAQPVETRYSAETMSCLQQAELGYSDGVVTLELLEAAEFYCISSDVLKGPFLESLGLKYSDCINSEIKVIREEAWRVGFKKDGKIWDDRGKGLKEYVDKSPDLRTVQEWVEFSKIEALKIEVEVRKYIEKLSF